MLRPPKFNHSNSLAPTQPSIRNSKDNQRPAVPSYTSSNQLTILKQKSNTIRSNPSIDLPTDHPHPTNHSIIHQVIPDSVDSQLNQLKSFDIKREKRKPFKEDHWSCKNKHGRWLKAQGRANLSEGRDADNFQVDG
ncbi:uncharacterized protein VP01_316g8 [Puccinia sorghi]|uniref:Uncharacterized protein n=1 Tax=Puccinia sorghi TaxID=27349 RepID=A0A0L6UYP8_9BASI|nr:uncharacterized protein VP01_316g8 [Puccinia sorghi]